VAAHSRPRRGRRAYAVARPPPQPPPAARHLPRRATSRSAPPRRPNLQGCAPPLPQSRRNNGRRQPGVIAAVSHRGATTSRGRPDADKPSASAGAHVGVVRVHAWWLLATVGSHGCVPCSLAVAGTTSGSHDRHRCAPSVAGLVPACGRRRPNRTRMGRRRQDRTRMRPGPPGPDPHAAGAAGTDPRAARPGPGPHAPGAARKDLFAAGTVLGRGFCVGRYCLCWRCGDT
jgi:hypothetical protein